MERNSKWITIPFFRVGDPGYNIWINRRGLYVEPRNDHHARILSY